MECLATTHVIDDKWTTGFKLSSCFRTDRWQLKHACITCLVIYWTLAIRVNKMGQSESRHLTGVVPQFY